MKRVKKILVALLAVVMGVLCLPQQVQAAESGISITVDEEMNFIPIPAVYEVAAVWKDFGDYGYLDHAEDLFMDENDILYVADTGNQRILKISPDGGVLAEYTEGAGVSFRNPKGVFVYNDGTIWVADSGNYRIMQIDQDGNDVAVYYKPDSTLLEDSFSFSPEKIAVSNTGYIYVLKGSNLMLMDSNNDFRGYVGSVAVTFSFQRFLIRTFGSQSQIESTIKQEPSAYNNFTIASDGFVYGVLASDENTGQIRKINSVGTNVYPDGDYGFYYSTDGTSTLYASFSDINVMDTGIITLCDSSLGLLYQYDQDGQLLAVFGGSGTTKGTYQNPISVESDSEGRLYVLDYSANTITVLEPTRFISLIHQAVYLYEEGRYEESKAYWMEVIDIDSNYAIAHSGYGNILYKEENYKEAMQQFYLANDKEGYSKAYAEYRHDIFRNYFGWIVLVIVVAVTVVCICYVKLRKWAAATAYAIEMGGRLE